MRVDAVRSRSAEPGPERASVLVQGPGLATALILTGLTIVTFALWPGLDLAAASVFYAGDNHFVAQAPWGEALRRVFYDAPFGLLALLAGLYGVRRLGLVQCWAPSGRGVVFLLVSLAAGPGLLVNVVLKDHSHRPRPVQVVEFGGTLPFRPVGRFDGACPRNCSFVSGEGSTGLWTLAPALLAPAAAQPAAVAGAFAVGAAAGLLRMAFGGHFLSDTILAGLFTWFVIIAAWRALFGRTAGTGPIAPPHFLGPAS